ncbi:heme transporter hrg1-B-like [Lytechinus pictus]|uniref:heme transporter hrg1-B-like n=1 Tax=Lytechinus pictus TaxID=7653 RepID=UPI0030B9C7CB
MDDFSGPSPLRMRCRIAFAVTGLIVGLAIFICFIAAEQFYNLHIALWGLASGVFAFLTLTVHIQHMRGHRDLWVYRLKFFIVLGFFVQLGSLIALVTYVVLGAVRGQDLMPVNGNDKGFYLAAVWVFMTWKWSFALFIYSRSYRKGYVTSDESLLI